ncbi:MAG: hypothetical protein AAF585_06235, partial [Verrucomicrobiota bacterium]
MIARNLTIVALRIGGLLTGLASMTYIGSSLLFEIQYGWFKFTSSFYFFAIVSLTASTISFVFAKPLSGKLCPN